MMRSPTRAQFVRSVFMLGIFVTSSVLFAHAEDPTVSIPINNAAPNISTISVASVPFGNPAYAEGITLSAAGYRTVHVTGTAYDPNGSQDLATTTVVFYRTNLATGASCTSLEKNCYRTTCAIDESYGTANEATYNCPLQLAYWADATGAGGTYASTTWTAMVTTNDLTGASSTITTTAEVNSMLALSFPDTINYGTIPLGGTSSSSVGMILTQSGNIHADVSVSGSDMICSVSGSIPVNNQRWSLTPGEHMATGTSPLLSSSTNTDLYIPRQLSTTTSSASLYWTIAIPQTPVGGLCNGTIAISAITAQETEILLDGIVSGVRYQNASTTGTTDEYGRLKRDKAATTTFFIGAAQLGEIIGDRSTDEFILVQDLFNISRRNTSDNKMLRVIRFLQSLDSDQNLDNGIAIPPEAHTLITNPLDVQNAPISRLREAVRAVYPARDLIGVNAAQNHLIGTINRYDPSD